jgi:hypothetical protein
MLTIRDLSKEVDMTAVRGGTALRWPGCGDEDSRERFDSDDRHHGERDGSHRHRCERNDDASPSFAPVGSFTNLPSCGWYDATKK